MMGRDNEGYLCAGVIRYRGARIQLLDLPGIIEGAKDGKGRGRQVRVELIHVTACSRNEAIVQIRPIYNCMCAGMVK